MSAIDSLMLGSEMVCKHRRKLFRVNAWDNIDLSKRWEGRSRHALVTSSDALVTSSDALGLAKPLIVEHMTSFFICGIGLG